MYKERSLLGIKMKKQTARQLLECQERKYAEGELAQIVVDLLAQIIKADQFFTFKQNEIVNEFVRLQVQTIDRYR